MNNTLVISTKEQKILSFHRDLELLHPHVEDQKWFTTEIGGTCNLTKLLVHPQQIDYYQWISSGINIQRWNAPNKWTPYDYKKLLGRYLPDLFHIYWHPQIEKVVQLDIQAIKAGRFAYRDISLSSLRAYVTGQIFRVQFFLKPSPETVIGRVFNQEWFNGDQPFPLYISKHDVESLLTKLEFDGDRIYFSRSVLYKDKFPEVIHVAHKLSYTAPMQPDPFISMVDKHLGKEMDADQLHALLKKLTFEPDNTPAVRIRMLHNNLKPHGLILRKHQRRLNSGRKYFYSFLQVNLEQLEHQSRDYRSIKNA